MPRPTLVLDTNFLIHGKALVNIDWLAKAGTSEVLLVVPWRVLGELEEHATDNAQPGRRRRAFDRRNVIRNRRAKPIPFKAGIALEVGSAPKRHHKLVDDAVLDEVRLRGRRGARAVLVTFDVTLSERADLAGLEVLGLDDDDDEPISGDASMAKRIGDLEAAVFRVQAQLERLLAVGERRARLRLARDDGAELKWTVAWTVPQMPTAEELGIAEHRGRVSAATRPARPPQTRGELQERNRRVGTAAVNAKAALRERAEKSRRFLQTIQLRVCNDAGGATRSASVSLIVPREFNITSEADEAASLRDGDLDEDWRIGDPPTATEERTADGSRKLTWDSIEVHGGADFLLPAAWIVFTPEHAPRVEIKARITAVDADPVEALLVFELSPSEVAKSWLDES